MVIFNIAITRKVILIWKEKIMALNKEAKQAIDNYGKKIKTLDDFVSAEIIYDLVDEENG